MPHNPFQIMVSVQPESKVTFFGTFCTTFYRTSQVFFNLSISKAFFKFPEEFDIITKKPNVLRRFRGLKNTDLYSISPTLLEHFKYKKSALITFVQKKLLIKRW